eukprot:SAG31_NODE_3097_length_4679_cov_2.040175_4_plen_71_part_00
MRAAAAAAARRLLCLASSARASAARIPYFDNFNVVDLFILKKLVQYRAMESGMIHLPSTVLCTDRCQSQP